MDRAPPESPTHTPLALPCLNCGYDLSGTIEDRCSECGEAFDRAGLQGWLDAETRDLPFGPLPNPGGHGVLFLSLFSPEKLGRWLPPFLNSEASRAFALEMRLLASVFIPLLPAAILAARVSDPAPFIAMVLIPWAVMVGSAACEAMIASYLAHSVRARHVSPEGQYAFWYSLCRCFAGHLLVSSTLCSAGLIASLMAMPFWLSRFGPPGALIFYLAPAPALLWWWYCLARAVMARSEALAGRVTAVLVIPVFAAVAIGIGGCVLLAVGLLLGAICSGFC